MKILFGIVGVILILVGASALTVAKTTFVELAGLILWVIAAQLITSAAIIEALNRLQPPKPGE